MIKRLTVIAQLTVLLYAGAQASGAAPRACAGSTTLGTVRILVRRPLDPSPLPLKELSTIPAGATLVWDPVRVSLPTSEKGEIAALVVQQSSGTLEVLEPRKAGSRQEWTLPGNPGVIALVLGPQGLSMGKVKSLVAKDSDLLQQLADYAEQTSEVEALVQTLANAEDSGASADAALKGFSARYGVALPKLDTRAASNQQATVLLAAVMPSAANYDPLAASNLQVQQSGGLAASVAGLFFGNTIGIAAGGTALFENLKTMMFPATEFRSAFAQTSDAGSLAFCTKTAAAKSRTRLAYLWAYRLPQCKVPAVALAGQTVLPLGSKSVVKLKVEEGEVAKDLVRARDWRLLPASGGPPIPITVTAGAADSLTLDLSKARLPAGSYRLAATWDWDQLSLGRLEVRPYSDFGRARLAPLCGDKLIEGHGIVTAQLTGADFEFVEKASWEKAAVRAGNTTPVHFALPRGPRAGDQESMDVDIDTTVAGRYRLLLAQSDGVVHTIPITVLPSNPKISNLPLRVNAGEKEESVRLEGSGLERIEAARTDAGTIRGTAADGAWAGTIRPKPGLKAGERFSLVLDVQGLSAPLTLENAVQVVGPRPVIRTVRRAVPTNPGIEVREDELPAGTPAGLVLEVDHLHDGAMRPHLELGCRSGDLRQALEMVPDEPARGASLSFAGSGALYLSVDAGAVGFPGCEITATVLVEPEGASEPIVLGRVVRLPRLDQFTVTAEPQGPNTYTGFLKGRDLDLVARAGWDAQHGLPVDAIPTPVPGQPGEQTLRIAVPWPAPAPHAPLYVWLPGEEMGRKAAVTE